jgi:hypothetical protein
MSIWVIAGIIQISDVRLLSSARKGILTGFLNEDAESNKTGKSIEV